MPPEKPTVLSAYLAKIIRGSAINLWQHYRRQKRVPPEEQESFAELEGLLPASFDMDAVLESRRIAAVISDFLRQTGKRKRYIFLSRYYYMRPIADIADALCISISTVNKTLSAVKKELREKLESEGIQV